MDTMNTVRVLAQEHTEKLAKIAAGNRKYVLDSTDDGMMILRWADTNELADPREFYAKWDQYAAEVGQSTNDLIDKAYVELDVEHKYHISKGDFDMIFIDACRYAKSVYDLSMVVKVEYWEDVLSYCVDVCEVSLQMFKNTRR